MGSEYHTSHIFFFPFLAPGHSIPMVDMAKLFASKGVKATIITTPLNEPCISKSIEKSKINGHNIHIKTIEFPSSQVCLPNQCENIDSIPSPETFTTFCKATKLLQEPLEKLLLEQNPDCVVSDLFLPWTYDSTVKFEIPRIVFNGCGFFSLCAVECMRLYEPLKNVFSDSETFVIPNLPGEIKMTRLQIPPFEILKEFEGMARLLREAKESELKSFGVIVNSFYELENVYADYYRKALGRKAWHIGPLFLCNKDIEEKANRGNSDSIDQHACLKWLDAKKPSSVVYLCFGSMANFSNTQLREIAMGLEATGKNFIWVVRRSKEDGDEWLPEGFEKNMEGKGVIIRGWSPQALILEHEATGAFVTHCGWNSILEGITARVPMVTWPVAAEQFYNEKLVNEVLKIGVPVGVKKWVGLEGDSVEWNKVEKAVKRIMEGEEADEMKNNIKVLSELSKRAVEEGGSSYSDLNVLIEELSLLRH
ncbi:unnamed protein product [Trifolium pratense]|uniref:Uncharacterized protein n=1 Tax=Trifolium pratense TaxID=57577 RepID=A0ACB0K349_TRIPR|nr:unnamed protein product [Trifolium pratense]